MTGKVRGASQPVAHLALCSFTALAPLFVPVLHLGARSDAEQLSDEKSVMDVVLRDGRPFEPEDVRAAIQSRRTGNVPEKSAVELPPDSQSRSYGLRTWPL